MLFFKKADTAKTYITNKYVAYRYAQSLKIFQINSHVEYYLTEFAVLEIKEHKRTWHAAQSEAASSTEEKVQDTTSATVDLLPTPSQNAGPLASGNVYEEKTLHLVLQHSSDANFVPGKTVELFKCSTKESSKIEREFNRLADQLLMSYGFSTEKASGISQSSGSTLPGRFMRFFLPFMVGVFVLLGILLMVGGKSTKSVAMNPLSPSIGAINPKDAQDMVAGLGDMGLDFKDPSVAKAWAALPKEQQDLLWGLTSGAASQTTLAQALKGASSPSEAISSGVTLDEDDMSKLRSAHMIDDGNNKDSDKVFYAFEDPMCSSCKSLSRQTAGMRDSHGLKIIPLGFLQGSRDLAAGALCSDNPSQAWDRLMSGVMSGMSKPCQKGYDQLDANNKLFESLGFDSTPTIVSLKGRSRVGSVDTASLVQWLASN